VLTSEIDRSLQYDDYNTALARLENGLSKFPDEPALLRLRAVAERKRDIAERREWLRARVSAARNLLHSGKPAEALAALELTSELMERVPADLRIGYADLKAAINECRREAEDLRADRERSSASPRGAEADMTLGARPSTSDATTRPMGQASNSPAHRRAPSNENGVLELTPPKGQMLPEPVDDSIVSLDPILTGPSSPPSELDPAVPDNRTTPELTSTASAFVKAPGWNADALGNIEKELASYIGPLARVLVKKAASTANSPEELYIMLAAHLERESDRKRFLAGRPGAVEKSAPNQVTGESSVTNIEVTRPHSELAQADIDRAARVLARYVGPIAGVLTKRAAPRADSPRTLYQLLAKHLDNDADRESFLRDCGLPKR